MHDETLRTALWEEMLNAHMREYYFARLAERYGRLDVTFSWGVAVLTSGAVATLAVKTLPPIAPMLLSVCAALASASMSTLRFAKRAATGATLHVAWSRLRTNAELLWARVDTMTDAELEVELRKFRQAGEALAETSVTTFSTDWRLVEIAQQHVASLRRLAA